MLRDETFKETLREDEETCQEVGEDQMVNLVSRIDFAILGFLWCEGEKEEKANFLFNLANSSAKKSKSFNSPPKIVSQRSGFIDEENIMVWTNKNMRYIFRRMFEFSIDLPYNLFETFETFTICDEAMMIEANPQLKKQLNDKSMTFFDFTNFQYRINYEDLYEDWFIDVVFGQASAKLFREQFIKKLSKNQKIGYIFASRDLRRRFKKAQ